MSPLSFAPWRCVHQGAPLGSLAPTGCSLTRDSNRSSQVLALPESSGHIRPVGFVKEHDDRKREDVTVTDEEALARQFEAHRAHLRRVALRMLGSTDEADDAIQEAWLRLSRSDPDAVDNLGGWLTTVVARVCLDMLRARSRRGEVARDDAVELSLVTSPEDEAVLADSVGLALLVVLDTLTPAERLAFVLHDLFAVPFDEIAPIVGRSPVATRQLASRARRQRAVGLDYSRRRSDESALGRRSLPRGGAPRGLRRAASLARPRGRAPCGRSGRCGRRGSGRRRGPRAPRGDAGGRSGRSSVRWRGEGRRACPWWTGHPVRWCRPAAGRWRSSTSSSATAGWSESRSWPTPTPSRRSPWSPWHADRRPGPWSQVGRPLARRRPHEVDTETLHPGSEPTNPTSPKAKIAPCRDLQSVDPSAAPIAASD